MKTIDPNKIQKKGCEFQTNSPITWCPGCPNHMILESTRRSLIELTKKKINKKNLVMITGIGCHGKIFDYLNISGFYGLHGRAIPVAIGIKLQNKNLKPIVFSGDGDSYTEGMEHFIQACRTNPDITLIVNNNQAFSLTTGQATATSQKGFKTKAEPGGSTGPLNPILLALSAGATFVARCNARDIEGTKLIMEKAIIHKGFSYVEILQDCLVYNKEANNRDQIMHKIQPQPLAQALELAREFDYNLNAHKIPLGIFYQVNRPTLNQLI